jgi:hypothetical protein
LLGDFNAKVGRDDILKSTTGNENLHEICNHNGVRLLKFASSKYLMVKSTIFINILGCLHIRVIYPDRN